MKTILIIDDDKVSLATAKGVLGGEYKVVPVLDGMQGLKYLETKECDLILLDINMVGMNGFEVFEEIKKNEKSAGIPVIFLTSDNDADTETRCLEAGAMDFISKPFVPSVICSRVNKTLELEEYRKSLAHKLDIKTQEVDEIKTKSYTDALTGLWNREYTSGKIDELLEAGGQGSLFMIDLDNFKAINDNYGHQEGDKVLNIFADTLREFGNEGDILCRIGGDEFVAFWNGKINRAELSNIAGDMILSLNKKIQEQGYDVKTSVSIGIAISGLDGVRFSKLYNCGDKALYYVKNNGKNFYRFYSDNVKEERERASKDVNLEYLEEILSRSDSGHGTYMLDYESFHHIYNFIKRFVERNDKKMVSVLFSLHSVDGSPVEESDALTAIDILDKAIFTSLRRVDISTHYSNLQTIVILFDTTPDYGEKIVERIKNCFAKLYTGSKIELHHSMADIKKKD